MQYRVSQVRTAFSVFAAVKRAWPLIVAALATIADALDAYDGTRIVARLVVSSEVRHASAFLVAAVILAIVTYSTYQEGA